jgi:hypothetical protein
LLARRGDLAETEFDWIIRFCRFNLGGLGSRCIETGLTTA